MVLRHKMPEISLDLNIYIDISISLSLDLLKTSFNLTPLLSARCSFLSGQWKSKELADMQDLPIIFKIRMRQGIFTKPI